MTDERMPPQDPRVEVYLEALASVRVPADLAASVATHVRERPSRRPSFRLPLLAGAAGLLLVVAIAMAAGWQPPFDVTPGPQATSPSASAGPAEAFEFARIATVGAELRTDAGAGSILRQTSQNDLGTMVLIRDRRSVAGRTWVQIEQAEPGMEDRFVWLPETIPSSGPTGYDVQVLEPTGWLPCPNDSDLTPEALGTMTQAQRLACLGPGSFTVGPVRIRPIKEDLANPGTPEWLAGPATRQLTGGPGDLFVLPVASVRLDPALGLDVPNGTWMRVTLHLDDPASSSCARTMTQLDTQVGDAADQVLWCRQQLVVTGYAEAEAPIARPRPPTPSELDGVRNSLPQAPIAGREGESIAFTGEEIVIWGGDPVGDEVLPPDGAALDVYDDGTWRVIAASPLSARRDALVAWTGSELLAWGGHGLPDGAELLDGAAWNPLTDTWRRLPAPPLTADERQAAAWNGYTWVVMSGASMAAYDPVTDTWKGQAAPPIGPDASISLAWTGDQLALLTHSWDGSELWVLPQGGTWRSKAPPPPTWAPGSGLVFGDGRLFAPGDRWPQDADAGQPVPAVATWNPDTDTWAMVDAPVPSLIDEAVWNGSQLVVIGEHSVAWDPESDTWSTLPGGGEDRVRESPSAIWAGDRLVVWGGAWVGHGDPQPDGWELVWVSRG